MAPCMIAVDRNHNQTLVVKPAFVSLSADLNVAKHRHLVKKQKG